MKRLYTASAVLVALLVIAPWGIGKVAERHVNRLLDQFVEQSPYLSIVNRKYRSGWFRSEQEVTFEVFGAWAPAINTVFEAGSRGDKRAEKGSKFKPPRFTVRNEILHGPVLWPFGLGAARVDTNIVWNVKLQHELFKTFGDDKPFRMRTRVGFSGDGTTTISSDARALEPGDGLKLTWDKFAFDVGFSRDWDHVSLKGRWPRFELRSSQGENFVMRDLKAEGSADRIMGDLYDTDVVFTIESMRMADSATGVIEATELKYEVETEKKGDFVDMMFKVGSGPIRLREFALQEVHYDFSMRRLHAASLDRLLVAMKESYSKPATSLSEVDSGMLEAYKTHGLELLEHDPEFAIDRISLRTKSGDGTIKGVIRFNGVTEADFEAGGMTLLEKVDLRLELDVAEALLVELGGEAGLGMATEGGFAVRRDGRLTSKIEYRGGKLKINGKSPDIPGVSVPAEARPETGPE